MGNKYNKKKTNLCCNWQIGVHIFCSTDDWKWRFCLLNLFNKEQKLQVTMTSIHASALTSSRSSVSFLEYHTLFQTFFHDRKWKQMSSSLDISGGNESYSWCSLKSQEPFLTDWKLLTILFLWGYYCANVYSIMHSLIDHI